MLTPIFIREVCVLRLPQHKGREKGDIVEQVANGERRRSYEGNCLLCLYKTFDFQYNNNNNRAELFPKFFLFSYRCGVC